MFLCQEALLRRLRDPGCESHADFAAKTSTRVKLSAQQLVAALNEQLSERRAGNAAYEAGDAAGALCHYLRQVSKRVQFSRIRNKSYGATCTAVNLGNWHKVYGCRAFYGVNLETAIAEK